MLHKLCSTIPNSKNIQTLNEKRILENPVINQTKINKNRKNLFIKIIFSHRNAEKVNQIARNFLIKSISLAHSH